MPYVKTTHDDGNMSSMKIVELYYTFICRGQYVIPKSKFEHFVMNTLPNISHASTEDEQCIFALYLSIRSLTEQVCGQLEIGEKTVRMAELQIATLSIDFHANFYLCCACLYVSLFHHGMGNRVKSDFYSHQFSFYFKKPNLDAFETHLKKIEVFWKGPTNEALRDFKSLVYTMPYIYEAASDKRLEYDLPEGVWDYVKSTHITSTNYQIYLDIMDIISSTIKKHRKHLIATMFDCHSDTFFQIEQVQEFLTLEGVKFNLMYKLSSITFQQCPIMEELAHDLSMLTEHPLFPYCSPAVVVAVLCISEHHLKCCQMIESGLKSRQLTITSPKTQQLLTIDFLEELKRDFRALQLLAKRYRFITLQHSDLLQLVEHFLDSCQIGNLPISQKTQPQENTTTMVMPNDEILFELLKYVQAVSQNTTNF